MIFWSWGTAPIGGISITPALGGPLETSLPWLDAPKNAQSVVPSYSSADFIPILIAAKGEFKIVSGTTAPSAPSFPTLPPLDTSVSDPFSSISSSKLATWIIVRRDGFGVLARNHEPNYFSSSLSAPLFFSHVGQSLSWWINLPHQ